MKLFIYLLLPLLIVTSNEADDFIGKWEIIGGSIIEIYKNDSFFYGKIHKRADNPISNFNGLDNNNPNKSLRNRPLIGIDILEHLAYNEGELSGGTIYNADSGKFYDVKIWFDQENKDHLYIRAYKSIFFKTFEARRVN